MCSCCQHCCALLFGVFFVVDRVSVVFAIAVVSPFGRLLFFILYLPLCLKKIAAYGRFVLRCVPISVTFWSDAL